MEDSLNIEQCIDEMIPYFGKYFAKQFMWGEPIRLDIKYGCYVQKENI